MSRVPTSSRSTPSKAGTSSSTLKPRGGTAPRAPSPLKTGGATTPRAKTPSALRTKASAPRLRTTSSVEKDIEPPLTPTKALSIRDVIAMRRAEAKKAPPRLASEDEEWNNGRGASPTVEEQDILGRASVSETIERAKRNGNLNLMSRSLPCLPKFLFESHLGVTPEPLVLYPESNADSEDKEVKSTIPSWQAQDLGTLKLTDNLIVELHPEISLFGSLKHLDLRNNKLTALPDSLADLVNLVFLDVSKNEISKLPPDLSSLPDLQTLLLADNSFTSLDFSIRPSERTDNSNQYDNFFAPVIQRATVPLPKLTILDASHNKLTGASIAGDSLPRKLTRIDLNGNPLGECERLLRAISAFGSLARLEMQDCELTANSFSFVGGSDEPFPSLQLLTLGECAVTEETITKAFKSRTVDLYAADFDTCTPGVLKVMLGKKIKKEKWEIEAERRVRGSRSIANLRSTDPFSDEPLRSPPPVPPLPSTPSTQVNFPTSPPKSVVKEAWEIDAEQGLLTEGAKRRARAIAAAAAAKQRTPHEDSSAVGRADTPDGEVKSSSPTSTLASGFKQYYDVALQSLTLPQALPRPRGHSRAVSLAPRMNHQDFNDANPLLPQTTLPLAKITSQPFAASLRILNLSNRRMEILFELPPSEDGVSPLPVLDELKMDGCGLSDTVSYTTGDDSQRSTKPVFQLLASLFPSISMLDLCHNNIATLTGVEDLIIPNWEKKRRGIKALRLQGNRIENLDALEPVWNGWMNDAKVDGWRLEEVDVRDNEISRLPAQLGLLPLDVLLVEGNTFRVPARRVWEREGTKGLRLWLRQRIEQ